MSKRPSIIPALPHRVVTRDAGGGIFAFIRTLRLAVRAKVRAEKSSGIAYAEIAIHVRELVSNSEDAAGQPGRRPSPEFRALAKQADAWCVEAYRLTEGTPPVEGPA